MAQESPLSLTDLFALFALFDFKANFCLISITDKSRSSWKNEKSGVPAIDLHSPLRLVLCWYCDVNK